MGARESGSGGATHKHLPALARAAMYVAFALQGPRPARVLLLTRADRSTQAPSEGGTPAQARSLSYDDDACVRRRVRRASCDQATCARPPVSRSAPRPGPPRHGWARWAWRALTLNWRHKLRLTAFYRLQRGALPLRLTSSWLFAAGKARQSSGGTGVYWRGSLGGRCRGCLEAISRRVGGVARRGGSGARSRGGGGRS